MKKEDVLKKNGELFGLRHLINLSSDCLDTPDFYWDKDNLESLYQKTCNHLNIAKRTRVRSDSMMSCTFELDIYLRADDCDSVLTKHRGCSLLHDLS